MYLFHLGQAYEHLIEQQLAAYPDVKTIISPRSYASTYNLALVTAQAMGWEITQSPKAFGMVGRVYAIEVTPDGRLIAGVDPGEPGSAVRG